MRSITKGALWAMAISVLVPSASWAQTGGDIGTVAGKITSLTTTIMTIVQAIMVLALIFIGVKFAQGDSDARHRLQNWGVGAVIIFAAASVAKFFMS